MNDDNNFGLILEFLANFAPGVTGRSAPITPELDETITKFAKGELGPEERAAAAAEILQNDEAVELLAKKIQEAA